MFLTSDTGFHSAVWQHKVWVGKFLLKDLMNGFVSNKRKNGYLDPEGDKQNVLLGP